mmetsp:Transcript_5549/g.7769  ORF Transcript_5549/g.7769 Transcript_5549/m.7769 type:complete len:244 (+) Transcript_5549:43-774(+)
MELDKFLRIVLYLLAVVPTATLIATYTITELRHDTPLVIPFISASIDYSPESCIGTLGLTITAALSFVAMFTKYLQVSALVDHREASLRITQINPSSLRSHNTAGFIVGCISLFGLIGVAAFQYHNVPAAHLVFAIMFFFGVGVHLILMATLDRKISEERALASLRMILSGLSIILFFPATFPMFWGYNNLSAAFEISNAAVIFSYFLTYYREFSRIKLTINVVDPKFMRSITQEEARLLMTS